MVNFSRSVYCPGIKGVLLLKSPTPLLATGQHVLNLFFLETCTITSMLIYCIMLAPEIHNEEIIMGVPRECHHSPQNNNHI
jgi:hypothetical protein